MEALLLGVYAALLLVAVVWIWLAPHHAVWLLLVLLPLHTLAMTLVFHAVHPSRLVMGLFQGWKDVLLAVGLLRVATSRGAWSGLRLHPVDVGVALLAALALASIPFHSQLGLMSQLLALRDNFVFIPLYVLGRLMQTSESSGQRTVLLIAGVVGAVVLLGIVERFLDPLQALVAIELPRYLDVNFHLRFPSYGGLPYSFFQANFARRIGSVFLDPVELAESGALAVAAAAGLLMAKDGRRRLGLAALIAGVVAPVLAAGRFELLITPVLLATVALAIRRLSPAVVGLSVLAVLYAAFSFTFYSWPYRGPGANPPPAGSTLSGAPPGQGNPTVSNLLPGPLDASLQSHFTGIRQALRDAVQYPLGQGLGTAGLNGARSQGTGIAEGQVLVTVHSLGDPGILLLVAVLLGGIVVTWRRSRAPSGADGLTFLALVLFVAILLTLPVAEILANTLLMTAAFWSLGQIIRSPSRANAGDRSQTTGQTGRNTPPRAAPTLARPS